MRFFFDALGRLTEEEKGNIINTYEYDIYGNRTAYTLTNAGAQVLQNSYTYDNLNRLTGVVNGTETTAYSYDGNGNVLYEQSGTMRYVYYSYNAAGLLTEKENVAGVTELTTDYAYNLDGNIRQETDTETGTTSYTYDGMGRLTSETAGGVTTLYSYDAYSNRASKTVGSGEDAAVTNYTYDANNRLLREHETVEGVEVSRIYTYDANGNQLAKAVHSNSATAGGDAQTHLGAPAMANAEVVLNRYDGLNRLISTERSINGETTKASYTYNAAGIRTSKTVNGVTTQHLLDGVNVVADVTNGTTTSFVRGLGLISMNANGAKSYYVTDGHGDVRALVNAAGTVTKRYDYDAFGNEVDADAADANPFRYCGEYYDAETGSVYLRARYYDARVGRFGAEDPARDGANWYSYCGGNPVNLVDPWGLIPTVMEAALMSQHIYDGNINDELSGGWVLIDVLTGGDSMKMGVYARVGSDGQVKEITCSFAGSQDSADWINNFEQPFGLSADMWAAKDAAGMVLSLWCTEYEITFVGHSKGGAEAAACAVWSNSNCIIFNPATVNLEAYEICSPEYYDASMTAFIVEGDILTSLLAPFSKPIDGVVYLPNQHPLSLSMGDTPIDVTKKVIDNGVQNHLMESVISALKEAGY